MIFKKERKAKFTLLTWLCSLAPHPARIIRALGIEADTARERQPCALCGDAREAGSESELGG